MENADKDNWIKTKKKTESIYLLNQILRKGKSEILWNISSMQYQKKKKEKNGTNG